MNKNITAVILIVLAIGIYFTYTKSKIDELKSIQTVNAEYQKAIDNAALLLKTRDNVIKADNSISADDKDRLEKMLPNNVDNVRLIIDVKDNIAARHGLFLKGITTSSPTDNISGQNVANASRAAAPGQDAYGVVTLSFGVSTSYQTFIDFMKDLESSLRIMDISSLTVTANDNGNYDFAVEIKTYWLKQ